MKQKYGLILGFSLIVFGVNLAVAQDDFNKKIQDKILQDMDDDDGDPMAGVKAKAIKDAEACYDGDEKACARLKRAKAKIDDLEKSEADRICEVDPDAKDCKRLRRAEEEKAKSGGKKLGGFTKGLSEDSIQKPTEKKK